ncbi:TIR domain-containing protein [Clostridium sp. B9]|uniref:TIR domain-containing protein n=1 Tax=Clostridium sp. B9 TaxID=3423224 RepID=UPI003D2EC714
MSRNYRNGTYVAFDGNGEVNPTKSDLKYFCILKAWQENDSIDFNFINSHEKTYSVRDTSSEETLKSRLNERMKNSKNLLVIVSEDTNYDRGFLNYEISRAIKAYDLPVIIAYVGEFDSIEFKYGYFWDVIGVRKGNNSRISLKGRLPKELKDAIENSNINCIHIPFNKDVIKECINKYGCNYSNLKGHKNTMGV